MGIIRLLLYGALLWLLFRLLKGLFQPAPKLRRPPGPGAQPAGRVEGGDLVQDPHCGVYIPQETAVRGADGSYYCSAECRDAHQQRER